MDHFSQNESFESDDAAGRLLLNNELNLFQHSSNSHGNSIYSYNEEFPHRTGAEVDETAYTMVPHMKCEEARLKTFNSWPANSPAQPSSLAEAGMYYVEREDTVQCFCCGGMLAGWEQGDDAWGEHSKYYPNCLFILGHNVGNVPLVTPRHGVNGQEVSLETYEMRLDTFRGKEHPIEHERLARAGFYSTGERDKVVCFRCGGGVKDWLPDEDPWEEHARHYPGCSFLQTEKGNEYVSRVQLRFPGGNRPRSCQIGFSSREEAEDPMKKREKLQREKLCKICMDGDRNIVFIPCGRLLTCEECSECLSPCPSAVPPLRRR